MNGDKGAVSAGTGDGLKSRYRETVDTGLGDIDRQCYFDPCELLL